MYNINIKSITIKDIIGKILTKYIVFKMGVNCTINVEEVDLHNENGQTHLTLTVNGNIETKEIPKLLKNLNVL